MKIDPITGALNAGGMSISPQMTPEELSAAVRAYDGHLATKNREWTTYRVRLMEDYFSIGISLFLKETKLIEITFSVGEAEDDTWENWSEENERERMDLHDCILRESLGSPPYIFPWGIVNSILDPHDRCSVVIVRYK